MTVITGNGIFEYAIDYVSVVGSASLASQAVGVGVRILQTKGVKEIQQIAHEIPPC